VEVDVGGFEAHWINIMVDQYAKNPDLSQKFVGLMVEKSHPQVIGI